MGNFAAWTMIVIWVSCAIGWILNVGQLVANAADPVTFLTVLKIIGIFAVPLGAILGWMGI